jgi:hypothetical protein
VGPQTSRPPLVCSPQSVTQDLHVIHLFTSNLTRLNLRISCRGTNGCGSARRPVTRSRNIHYVSLSTCHVERSRGKSRINYLGGRGKLRTPGRKQEEGKWGR